VRYASWVPVPHASLPILVPISASRILRRPWLQPPEPRSARL